MEAIAWYFLVGALFVLMALLSTWMESAPLSRSIVYLAVGIAIGPAGTGLLDIRLDRDAALIERIAEIAVLISVFTAGLKMAPSIHERRWHLPVRLATVSIVLTAVLIALAAAHLFGYPPAAALLIGAILAPTDPVLAGEVQVEHTEDRDRLRFSLTGEAGLNDGTGFPLVALALLWMSTPVSAPLFGHWLLRDVLVNTVGAFIVGAALGAAVGKLVPHLRARHESALGLDDLLSLGVIAIAYASALLLGLWGFVAVFAAGLGLRFVAPQPAPPASVSNETPARNHLADQGGEASAKKLVSGMLEINATLERIAEVTAVILIGSLLKLPGDVGLTALFIAFAFLIARPLAVIVGLWRAHASRLQLAMMAWFGVRGVGSLFYIAYAVQQGPQWDRADEMEALILTTVAASIVLHGVSVAPLMRFYERHRRPRPAAPAG